MWRCLWRMAWCTGCCQWCWMMAILMHSIHWLQLLDVDCAACEIQWQQLPDVIYAACGLCTLAINCMQCCMHCILKKCNPETSLAVGRKPWMRLVHPCHSLHAMLHALRYKTMQFKNNACCGTNACCGCEPSKASYSPKEGVKIDYVCGLCLV